MSLVPARCINCGSFISADNHHKYIICPYCRMQYTAEEVIRNFNLMGKKSPASKAVG